ncbi:hypothetical protein [Streptomyces sp. NPDC048639]|uniref:hypothetical protein n=1 Tax=Streptomyces sp. NPDC048639 TaxID=3365581 RepID=UPI003712ACB9
MKEADGPEGAATYMRDCYLLEFREKQREYVLQREQSEKQRWESVFECLERGELEQAAEELRQASDPSPELRVALEREAEEVIQVHREPAVLVRPSSPHSRDVFHRNERCGLISGDRRHPDQASWMLLGDAEATGYRPCARCADEP